MPSIELEVGQTTLQEMEAVGVVEWLASPYGDLVLMVPWCYRMGVDFRPIDELVRRDACPPWSPSLIAA